MYIFQSLSKKLDANFGTCAENFESSFVSSKTDVSTSSYEGFTFLYTFQFLSKKLDAKFGACAGNVESSLVSSETDVSMSSYEGLRLLLTKPNSHASRNARSIAYASISVCVLGCSDYWRYRPWAECDQLSEFSNA